MSRATGLLAATDLREEADSDLGDPRRTERLKSLTAALGAAPSASYPSVFNSSELEAYYRFVRNDQIVFDDILQAHRDNTIARARTVGSVLLIHDTTEFNFPLRDEVLRDGLCRFSSKRQGFLAHASLVVSSDGPSAPLGVLGFRPFAHTKQLANKKAVRFWDTQFGAMDSEYDRWLEAVSETDGALDGIDDIIHLMDREADSYELLASMLEQDHRFIVRLGQDRNTSDPDTEEIVSIKEALISQPVLARRRVELSARTGSDRRTLSSRKKHPARGKRAAKLEFRARTVRVNKPKRPKKDLSHLPASIEINVVEALETNPPEGEEPVRWILATTEPISEVNAALQVVDHYRSRWLIEEYFKAIKTGCAYTKRQLESVHTLLLALAIDIPIAWHLLVMRHLSRHADNLPASVAVSPAQLAILKAAVKKWKWSENPTVREVTLAIARLGGHLKSNGEPGWQTLGRGYQSLLVMEVGWRAAMEAQ